METRNSAWKESLINIIHGLKEDVDVSMYAKPDFTPDQMSHIMTGLQSGIDMTLIAKPEYDPSTMILLKRCVEIGVDISDFDGSDAMIENYRNILDNNYVDIRKQELFDRTKELKDRDKYSYIQLVVIDREATIFGASYDVINRFINPNMDIEYIQDLILNLYLKPGIIDHVSPDMDLRHIEIIAHCINNGVDFDKFKPYLDKFDEYERLNMLKPWIDPNEEEYYDDCDEEGDDFESSETYPDNNSQPYSTNEALNIAMRLMRGEQ